MSPITAMDVRTSSTLLGDLSAFLRNPEIRLSWADEVESLRSRLAELQKDYDELKQEYVRVSDNYRDLMFRCLDLQDILRSHGIKWRK